MLSSKLDGQRHLLHQQLLENEHLLIESYRLFNSVPDFIRHAKDSAIGDLFSWADIVHVYGLYSLFVLNKFVNLDKRIVFSVGSKFNIDLKNLIDSGSSSLRNLAKLNYLASVLLPTKFFSVTLSRAHKIISWTRYMQQEVNSLGVTNSFWLPPGVNVDRFQPEANTIGKNFVFLYLGYLASARGVTDLLTAFEFVNKKWPSTKLIFSHTGMHPAEQDLIMARIRKSKSRDAIEITGFYHNISEIINRANCVVLPFRTIIGYSQPPLTVLEALAHGRPVITTSVGCLPELIVDGVNGYRVGRNDPQELARAMLKMRNGDLRFMSEKSMKYISINHNWPKISEATIRLYKNVLCAS